MSKRDVLVTQHSIESKQKNDGPNRPKLHYGVRLRVDQLKYLKEVQNPSEWIRKAIDEKYKREMKEVKESE